MQILCKNIQSKTQFGIVENFGDMESGEASCNRLFTATTLSACILEFNRAKYETPRFTIAVYETNDKEEPGPDGYRIGWWVGEIDMAVVSDTHYLWQKPTGIKEEKK